MHPISGLICKQALERNVKPFLTHTWGTNGCRAAQCEAIFPQQLALRNPPQSFMSSPASTETVIPSVGRAGPHSRREQRILAIALVIALGLLCLAFLFARFWPFERKQVLRNLAEASDSKVEARGYHKTYFPPGCIIDGVIFRHGEKSTQPLITIERLIIRGSYVGMFTNHVTRIIADGARVFIPAFGSGVHFQTQHSKIIVNEVVVNGTVVEFESRNSEEEPLKFDIHEGSVRNVGWNGPLAYRLKLHNPVPPGELEAAGELGGWRKDDPGETPFSGEYKFKDADLHVFHGIAGKLSSGGKFGGVLKHLDISGSTDVPDFEVVSSGHKVELITDYTAYINALNGDTFLTRVDAHFRRTRVAARGSIARASGRRGKTALLDLGAPRGRIEDILWLFVKEPRPPMSGPVGLKANVEIPSGARPFLEKVKLRGVFGIDEGSFTKPETQKDVNKLSAGARGENKDDVETAMADLKGQVVLEDGIAKFSDLSFGVPGARANLHGTYNIINHKIDLHGPMKVDSQISNTASGMKALLLKMMDPFFKKKKKGEVVPVHISGTYEHPQFGLDLARKQAQKSSTKQSQPSD